MAMLLFGFKYTLRRLIENMLKAAGMTEIIVLSLATIFLKQRQR
jgi:hypothetical protein